MANLKFPKRGFVFPMSRSACLDLAAATWAFCHLRRRASRVAAFCSSFRSFSFVRFSSAGDALNTPCVVRAVALTSSNAVLKLCHTRIACVSCGVPAAVNAHPAPVAPNSITVCRSTVWARQLRPRPIRPVGFDLLSLLNAAPLTPPPKVLIAFGRTALHQGHGPR